MTILTRDVGGDLRQRRLAEALVGPRSDRHQVRGSGMEAGEHVVGLVPQLGHGATRPRHVDPRVGRLDALVADLEIKRGNSDQSFGGVALNASGYQNSPCHSG